jgi:hypothetical protein
LAYLCFLDSAKARSFASMAEVYDKPLAELIRLQLNRSGQGEIYVELPDELRSPAESVLRNCLAISSGSNPKERWFLVEGDAWFEDTDEVLG